jgi:signal transduction histidine kinase
MTIKQRLFFSQIRLVMIIIGSLIAALLIYRAMTADIVHYHDFQEFHDVLSLSRVAFYLVFLAFLVFLSIINSMVNQRMMKKIIKPLEILNNGVKQIHENNFAYRIEYHGNDEYSPVCETFNQMAAQLEASTANRRLLLAGISHDLRTPLTAIDGYLDGLRAGVPSTPEMREQYFDTIKSNTASMDNIIEQLFLFSKLDMNEFPFTPHRFDIVHAISDMIEELSEEYTMRGLSISIANSPKNIFVYADVFNFRRVLINILENSANYKEKETAHMEISASLDNNYIQLRFTDDGPGVSPDTLPDLFNVFYRTDPSRHTTGQRTEGSRSAGSGLGLAISAKIIERSGGTIYAENGNAGGLVVIIRLPIDTGAV